MYVCIGEQGMQTPPLPINKVRRIHVCAYVLCVCMYVCMYTYVVCIGVYVYMYVCVYV